MGSDLPKQFLPLQGKPILFYSLEVFLAIPQIDQIVIVCEPEYRHLFQDVSQRIHFAQPGERRQDSVFNGLSQVSKEHSYVCVHDSARPFISKKMMEDLIQEGFSHGAAVIAMPLKFTIKESDGKGFVFKTHDRSRFYEIQTPQMARIDLLQEGFRIAHAQNMTVTDDVSLVELLPHPVKFVPGSYTNIKITTPDDLSIARQFLSTAPA